MPTNTSHRERLVQRWADCWELRLKGWSESRIAAHLGLHQGTVSRILTRLSNRTLAKIGDQVERHKLETSLMLDLIVDESLQAWERSKKPHSSVTRSTAPAMVTGEPDVVVGTVNKVTERTGLGAHLQTALAALDRKRALWGLDAARGKDRDIGPSRSVAQIAADLASAAAAFEAAAGADEDGGGGTDDRGGSPDLPDGPDPVQ